MRLKHLDLHGFKTFASRTEFVFPTGIAAIVGPNGSGKSNVADAVRWVLGEQSFSMLRAKKTEELIFAGGEGRARSGMAEVIITLDNSDGYFPIEFSEVTIGRRAYRDGENEYLLNGNKVRLRDVQELLAQTGLARRTYAVIGQGLIDQALSLRAEERRALFEEAAGISLYQHKREDALRRLDETQRNLERVQDILAEIGPRVRQLERQARRAQDYGRLSAELQELQRVWFGYHWLQAQAGLRAARDHAQAHHELVEEQRAALATAGERLEALRRRQLELRIQTDEWRRAATGVRQRSESLQRELAVLAERARSLQEQADAARDDLAPLEGQIAELAQQAERARADLDEVVRRAETQAQDMETARLTLAARQAERQAVQQAIAATQAEIRRVESDAAQLRSQRGQIEERRLALELDSDRYRQAIHSLVSDMADDRSTLAALDAESARLTAQIHQHRVELAEAGSQLDRIRGRQAQLDGESAQALRAEAELRARYDALRAARATLAGFDTGARSVLSARLPGVRGAVARLIDVPLGWERAIEAALGTDLQAVLIDEWAGAEAARAHLGESGGRATLLPLDSLRRPDYPLPPNTHRAADLVGCEAAIRPAIEAVLGHFVAVDDLAQARALLPDLPPGVHIVTRSGEVLRSSGAVVIGRSAASGDLMEHERDWRELPDRIKAAAGRGAALESERAREAAQADEALQRQAELVAAIRQLEEALGAQAAARTEVQRRVESIERESAWQNERIAQAEADLRSLADRDAALAEELERQARQLVAHQQSLQAFEQQLAALPTEEHVAQVTSLETAMAVAEQLRQGADNVWQSYRSALERAQAQRASRRGRIEAIRAEQAQLEEQLAARREQADELAGQLDQLQARIDPAEAEVRDLDGLYAASEREDRSARNRLQELESRHNLAVMDAARREDELNHLRARIDEELGLVQLELADLSGPQPLPLRPIVTELPIVSELPEGLEQEMQRLKAHVRRLGPINPEAQAEYLAEKERHEFLSAQSADLTQAIERLKQVIVELDALMEKSLQETFQAIAEEFRITFAELFGGGSARLVLTEPDNLTVTGVDIIARPPGKKQQGLALLSGGERSLTAAALLFAILKVKPPPFCILDETDAALDEANVGRFRDMIRRLSHDTQFALITHNRGTIEAADTIYGITMERDSSSRVYSLKLEGDGVAA